MTFENSLAFARHLDEGDLLKHYRSRFFIPQHGGRNAIYFTGNSLGLQPKSTGQYIQQELDDWAKLGVEGHFHARNPWYSYHEQFALPLSRIVGTQPDEVITMNALTVNLHLLLTTFYRPNKERFKIICESKAFPSDQYAFESQARVHGLDPADAIIEVEPRAGEFSLRHEDILATIRDHGSRTAVVVFSGVQYYTGQVFDIKSIAEASHQEGAFAGFDLAHAAGNVELRLHDWEVDFACWCSYKYLNSGPGGVAGAFIHSRHIQNTWLPRLGGWWGHNKDTRFKMERGFEPIATAEGWQLSNAPVLSMAAHKAAVDIFDEAGMDLLLKKSSQLTSFLFFMVDEINRELGEDILRILTPRQPGAHGCQVSIMVRQKGKEVFDALSEHGVWADWRHPDVIRVAPVPLYNTFEEVWHFGRILQTILKSHLVYT